MSTGTVKSIISLFEKSRAPRFDGAGISVAQARPFQYSHSIRGVRGVCLASASLLAMLPIGEDVRGR